MSLKIIFFYSKNILVKTLNFQNNYYHNFKTQLEVDLRQSSGYWLRPRSRVGLTRVSIIIKVVIIIVLNLFGSRPAARPGLRVWLTIDPDQRKSTNGYYHSFKTQLKD
jgi:hypothetical protein